MPNNKSVLLSCYTGSHPCRGVKPGLFSDRRKKGLYLFIIIFKKSMVPCTVALHLNINHQVNYKVSLSDRCSG